MDNLNSTKAKIYIGVGLAAVFAGALVISNMADDTPEQKTVKTKSVEHKPMDVEDYHVYSKEFTSFRMTFAAHEGVRDFFCSNRNTAELEKQVKQLGSVIPQEMKNEVLTMIKKANQEAAEDSKRYNREIESLLMTCFMTYTDDTKMTSYMQRHDGLYKNFNAQATDYAESAEVLKPLLYSEVHHDIDTELKKKEILGFNMLFDM